METPQNYWAGIFMCFRCSLKTSGFQYKNEYEIIVTNFRIYFLVFVFRLFKQLGTQPDIFQVIASIWIT